MNQFPASGRVSVSANKLTIKELRTGWFLVSSQYDDEDTTGIS